VTETDAQGLTGLPERHAGRVIVLDPADRVLLLRYDDALPNGRHWTTPGGGLNHGEDYAAAAARELAEETGWTDVVLLREVHQRSLTMEYAGRLVHQHERHYLARTDQPGRPLGDVAAMHAADGIAAWRWWSLDELDSTAEVIWPAGLAGLIRAARAEDDDDRTAAGPAGRAHGADAGGLEPGRGGRRAPG
jgi:ADP-ribose pyrophosphatase YjhB (NUDIX family)